MNTIISMDIGELHMALANKDNNIYNIYLFKMTGETLTERL
jgi:hypothetical protein